LLPFTKDKRATNFQQEVPMAISIENKEYILKSIDALPPHRIEEVIDFIEFLRTRSHGRRSAVTESSLILQQASLSKIWEDDEDLYEL
jgi:hypothetical protein